MHDLYSWGNTVVKAQVIMPAEQIILCQPMVMPEVAAVSQLKVLSKEYLFRS
jgi:hypothetical protein